MIIPPRKWLPQTFSRNNKPNKRCMKVNIIMKLEIEITQYGGPDGVLPDGKNFKVNNKLS